jgi:hypothetical protein
LDDCDDELRRKGTTMTTEDIVNSPPAIGAASRLMELASLAQGACNCGCGDQQEVDAGLCPIPVLEFPRFFAGQLVQPSDLTGIEQRIFSHEQLRARHTIGWGIGCGFRVAIDGQPAQNPLAGETGILLKGATLRVEAGYGIDRYGRDVYMAKNYTNSLETLFAERAARIEKALGDPWCAIPGCQPKTPTHYCVAVRYKECLANPAPSYAQQCGTPKTICEYSRVEECVEIRLFGEDEFPEIPAPTAAKGWCGLPAADHELADLWDILTSIPHGKTDVASAPSLPLESYAWLAERVATFEARERDRGSCDDLLHAPRPCDPCMSWPWIPLACFISDGTTITQLDCRVRRTIYSLQEITAAMVHLMCIIEDLLGQRGKAPFDTQAVTKKAQTTRAQTRKK